MTEMKSLHIIQNLRKRWIMHSLLHDFLLAAGTAFLLIIIANKFFGVAVWWVLLIFTSVFATLILLHVSWKTTEESITQLLNQTHPQLQESAGLVLRPYASLNSLEQLQYKRTVEALANIAAPPPIQKKRNKGIIIFAGMALAGAVIWLIPFHTKKSFNATAITTRKTENIKPEILLPQVKNVRINIQPPAYTARHARVQDKFNLTVEEGSAVQWQLNTTMAVKSVKFIFNDSLSVPLHAADQTNNLWQLNRSFSNAGFYALSIDGNLSELYKIEIIKDLAPVIHVQSPKQYTTIDYGEAQKVSVRTDISDDYGITDASISATIASGSGEAVKFKEQKIALPGFDAGKTQYQLQKLLLLNELGMHPGDELYFYIKATDNHQQETRSDIFIVNLPDTAQLMSLDGLANGLNFKPEYFRSERQIIMETEQLLKDKDTISEQTFKNKSNNLGIDQKLLRLRYGKFLGEEDEFGETESAEQDELKDISNFNNEEKIAQAYTDKHDNAEDASYFDPALKKQLKETLTEMWGAEMRLRTFKPQEALAFEYKALRLLKDLQQKSRAYVAKTGFKTTPLDLKKRLTGDPTKIIEPAFKNDFKENDAIPQAMRNVLALLEDLKMPGYNRKVSPQALNPAVMQLNEKAMQQPSVYLPAVQALRRITEAWNKDSGIDQKDILSVENGLQQLLSAPVQMPAAETGHIKQTLSKQYFDNLQRRRQ